MPESIIITPPSIDLISITDPGAGRDFSYGVPADHVFLIHAFHIHFRAAAGGANRATLLQIRHGADIFLDIPIDSNIPPGGIVHYSWASGFGFKIDAATNAATAPLPNNLYLPGGYAIVTLTTNLAIFDQFDHAFLYVSPFILPIDRG